MPKKLEKKISQKLEKLQELLANLTEAQVIDPDDPETWDADTLYNLQANLQAALQLLADQKTNRSDEFGESLILATGLCSLLDDWVSQKEAENE